MQAIGTIVDDKFELLKEIGSGGFGTVYRARQIQFERHVALKVLDAADIAPDVLKRFEREAKILQSFQSKFIPAIYGFGLWQNKPYMAIELVDGMSLEEVLQRHGPMSLETLRPIVVAVAEALGYAHAHGVAHRDLSPANILLVNKQGMPAARLIDFGLACFTAPDLRNRQRLTEVGYAVGTLFFMSPEQCLAQPADGRSDIYALGCIIYRALIGTPPFTDDNAVLLLRNHVQESLPRLPEDLPTGLQSVLDRATSKEPDERYQTAEEFLQDWQKMDAEPKGAKQKFKVSLGILFAGVVLLAAIAFFQIFGTKRTVPTESAASLLPEAHATFMRTMMGEWSPEGVDAVKEKARAQLQRVWEIDNRTHELVPRQRSAVLDELSIAIWQLSDKTQYPHAFELAKEQLKMDVAANKLWLQPGTYTDIALATDPPQRREAIDYLTSLLTRNPPYPARTKTLMHILIAKLYAANGDVANAEKNLPPGITVPNDDLNQWRTAKELIEKARQR